MHLFLILTDRLVLPLPMIYTVFVKYLYLHIFNWESVCRCHFEISRHSFVIRCFNQAVNTTIGRPVFSVYILCLINLLHFFVDQMPRLWFAVFKLSKTEGFMGWKGRPSRVFWVLSHIMFCFLTKLEGHCFCHWMIYVYIFFERLLWNELWKFVVVVQVNSFVLFREIWVCKTS